MQYWGGAGITGDIHPSLNAYIDCFESAPFPKAFPRGGGVWDQDPVLMRDFRIIRAFAVKWKDNQRQLAESGGSSGTTDDLEEALNKMLEEMGEEGTF